MSSLEGGRESKTDDQETSSSPPNPIYNWMSVIGSVVSATSLAAAVFFVVIGLVTGDESGYAGLILIIPAAFTGLGFALVSAGYVRERRRQKKGLRSSLFDRTEIDPWGYVSRTGLVGILTTVVVATFAIMGAGVGSIAVVEYSESNEFCGEACHFVMAPEYATYDQSPHGQIACVECHVGPGGDSYVRAKTGGLRQLWAIVTDNVTRPIPTPIHRRRLSDEMCASCHFRNRNVGYKIATHTYFSGGEDVVPTRLGLLVKVGGGDGSIKGDGIHDSMLVSHKIQYVARDPQRLDIPWVRITHDDGGVTEYMNEDDPLTDEEREIFEVRVVECVDCHSRAAHRFRSPIDSVNEALASGLISPEIPYIKEAAVRALDQPYETTSEALKGIGENLISFYEEEDEELIELNSDGLAKATEELRLIYQKTIFPEMKADWKAHPNNSGHLDSPGCFRCHNEAMVDENGESLFHDCTSCHAVLAQDEMAIGTIGDLETGRSFIHPEDGSSFDESTLCSECHTGGAELYD